MTFSLGTTVGDYEVIDIIESSKTGMTYKVRNREANRFEAMRVLTRGAQDDNDRVERFVREMKLHGRLQHPNIVRFYNASQIEGHAVMTTELIDGGTLEQTLEGGALPPAEAVRIADAFLAALESAHQIGIVHREVTPANILLSSTGAVKLSGFAMAKSAADPQLTQVGAAVGNVWYMSPEQVKGVDKPGPASDLYSSGVVLYQLLTGKRPFDSQSQFEVMTAHVMTVPKPPSSINPAVPPELDAVVMKSLQKEPAARFLSASDFRAALAGRAMPATSPAAEPRPHPEIPQAAQPQGALAATSPSPLAQYGLAALITLIASMAWIAFLAR